MILWHFLYFIFCLSEKAVNVLFVNCESDCLIVAIQLPLELKSALFIVKDLCPLFLPNVLLFSKANTYTFGISVVLTISKSFKYVIFFLLKVLFAFYKYLFESTVILLYPEL